MDILAYGIKVGYLAMLEGLGSKADGGALNSWWQPAMSLYLERLSLDKASHFRVACEAHLGSMFGLFGQSPSPTSTGPPLAPLALKFEPHFGFGVKSSILAHAF